MGNPFKGVGANQSGLVYDLLPVTPNDGADNVGNGNVAIGLYIGTTPEGGGTVAVNTVGGNTRTIPVAAGQYLVVGVERVLATGTTATDIFAAISGYPTS